MAESRQELLQWMNSLLQLNITKVEQCGTGAPLCQIFDSIFLDIPMSRVKFNVNNEYGYIQNFKILQNSFTKHQVDRNIPIEALVKCKMQDNLEFLQWTKRYWDQYFPGIEYDAVGRRKGSGPAYGGGGAPAAAHSMNNRSAGSAAARPMAAVRRPGAGSGARAAPGPRAGSAAGGGGGAANAALQQENAALKESITSLERERDFYFNKLRDIEIVIQQECETRPELETEENGLVPRMQMILYSTEEGFEIPNDEDFDGAADGADHQYGAGDGAVAEEETF